jgi:hypothetical protein
MVNFIQILFATERMLGSTEGPAQSGRALNLAISKKMDAELKKRPRSKRNDREPTDG